MMFVARTLPAVVALLVAWAGFKAHAVEPFPSTFNTPRQSVTLPTEGAMNTATVVTWNIDRGTELDTIGATLDKRPADLYLLQEVDSHTKRGHNVDEPAELARRLHMNFVYGTEFEELSQENAGPAYTGQATLTRLPIRQARILGFTGSRVSGSRTPGCLPSFPSCRDGWETA